MGRSSSPTSRATSARIRAPRALPSISVAATGRRTYRSAAPRCPRSRLRVDELDAPVRGEDVLTAELSLDHLAQVSPRGVRLRRLRGVGAHAQPVELAAEKLDL